MTATLSEVTERRARARAAHATDYSTLLKQVQAEGLLKRRYGSYAVRATTRRIGRSSSPTGRTRPQRW